MRKNVALLALVLLLLPLVHGVSSSEALEMARKYLERDESAVLSQYNPIEFESLRYWFIYFTPVGYPLGKNLVFIVSDESGAVVSDEETLRELILLDYKIDNIIEKNIKKNKVSFTDLQAVFEDARTKISASEYGLSSLVSQVESKGYSVSFGNLEDALAGLKDQADELSFFIGDGISLEQDFANTPVSETLEDLFSRYNQTLAKSLAFMESVEKYYQAVNSKRTQVIESRNISYDDKTKIVDSLDSIRNVGVELSFKSKVLSPVVARIETLLLGSEKSVNDTVQSFLFRKLRVEAVESYDNYKAVVQDIFENEFQYTACDIDLKELNNAWRATELLVGKGTRDSYAAAMENFDAVGRLIETINEKYKICVEGPPKPPKKPFDYAPFAIAIAVIGVGYAAYWYLKKKQQMESEEL